MNILLLGANGFVGSYLYSTLKDNGHSVKTASRHGGEIIIDLSKYSQYEKGFENYSFDIVVTSAVVYADSLPESLVNVQIVTNILEYFHNKVKQIIFLSSLSALEENKFSNAYNYSKYLSEEAIRYYTINYSNICVLRFAQIIDINSLSRSSQKGFHYIVDSIKSNTSFGLYSLNDCPRSYIPVIDTCRIVIAAINQKIMGFHNIVIKPLFTLLELVNLLTRAKGDYSEQIQYLNKEAIHYYIPETSKAFLSITDSCQLEDYLVSFIKQ